ncbi:MAG: coenzyme F420-0:L-glutamate ligase [Myxococcales bacterium]|nr:coenzyme F420-0:L-glutamate ligase [Myxococcales bacterium]
MSPEPAPTAISCAPRLVLTALPGLPLVQPGDDVAALVCEGLERAQITPVAGDVVVVTSKLLSRAEGRFVDLSAVVPSPRARELAAEVDKDPALVELVLRESLAISRATRGVLIVRHRLGFVSANAGIDASNAQPASRGENSGPFALLLPEDPDAGAAAVADRISAHFGLPLRCVGVVITDSHGRPFRQGTVGAAIGVAGLPPLWEQQGSSDLYGRTLEVTVTALADQVAAAADLVAGQGAEGRPVVHVRGLRFPPRQQVSASQLQRPLEQDLYA